MGDNRLLIPYRLRVVRVGVQATWLTVAVLVLFAIVAEDDEVRRPELLALVAVAAIGAVVVSLLPWRSLFDRGVGIVALNLWSILDIALLSAGLWASGGIDSPVFIGYALTTIFFSLAYPPRSQALLLAFTYLAFGLAVGIEGSHISIGAVVVRVGGLAVLAMIGGRISSELMEQMGAHSGARGESERRAGLLAVVAEAAQNMTAGTPEEVLDVVSQSVTRLGFDVAAVSLLDPSGITYRVVSSSGLSEDFIGRRHNASEGLTGMTIRAGRTVILGDYSAHPLALEPLRGESLRSAVGTPIDVEGHTMAVLIGMSRSERRLAPGEVDVFELLAGLAGRAFESARRFQSERRAVERLEELDRLKTEFLTTVSHEIRTPLTAIQGMGTTLGERWDELDEDLRRELVARLNANTRVLNDVITALLDFSRVEAGRLEVRLAPLDVGALVVSVLDRLALVFAEHEVTVHLDQALTTEADPVLLERVVENLLANAAKHTSPGTRVGVSARRQDGDVEIRVSDEGPGIPEHELRHLGERFFRGGDPKARRARGTGLGLALVTEVLRLHGSRLEVESTVGKGSAFWFLLPLAEEPALRSP